MEPTMSSPDTKGRREVLRRLRKELGWYAWANDIERGRNDHSDLADALDGAVREKRDWLKRHTFQPNTEGEAMHDRQSAWCENATALITYMQEATDAA